MAERAFRRKTDIFPLKVVVLAVLGTVAFVFGSYLFLTWSTRVIDAQSIERQTKIVEHVIGQMRLRVAHDQESSTVWDEAVETVKGPRDEKSARWIDDNLGSWMVSYFGHDAAFVLNPLDEPIYAFVDGKIAGPESYDAVRIAAEPMLKELRDKLRAGDTSEISERILSPGVTDFSFVEGHPAIVSLKPIISDTGEVEQTPGEEYVHIAVKNLDSDFLQELAVEYGFHELYFSATSTKNPEKAELPLVTAKGNTVGYFVWKPYGPGSAFLASIMPALVSFLVFLVFIVTTFIAILYRRLLVNRAQEERIRYLASHDALTGLLNRSSFERHLDTALSGTDDGGAKVAVIYLDLDRFKQINDTFGHSAGDEVIREAVGRINALLPPTAHFCRIGGDEFNILMPFAEVSDVEKLCAAIIAVVVEPFVIEGQNAFIGISMGVAYSPTHGTNRSELTRKADVALYNAKASGRGRFTVFGPHMDVIVRERAEIERDLRQALENPNQFTVLYQPKYLSQTGEVQSVEALVRWHHPTRGLLSPVFFIPIAEETGLIKELGRHVLEEACKAGATWPVANVAVNVSPIQWRDPHFAKEVIEILKTTGFEPRKLELEITETAWMDDSAHCAANIRTLRDIGVGIALDDFGTGFSTFGRLHETEVDHIKIDRMFVEGLGKSRGDEAIIQAIVELARAKGLKTTAEGVQTVEQSDFLKAVGCDELQGFLFSEPVSREAIDTLLEPRMGKGSEREELTE
ncbi:MAG: EAL domain-containing protein [Rhizobium sp.]